MITEDCVCCGVAKLLKEKGFNERTYCYYTLDGEIRESLGSAPWNNSICETSPICAPTLQMAMKWLREKKQIFITIMFCDYPALQKSEWIPEVCTHDSVFDEPSIAYPTYEEACEGAIKYCLENLV